MSSLHTAAPQPPSLEPTAAALEIHREIVVRLGELVAHPPASPLDPAFDLHYGPVLELFERYQHEVIAGAGQTVRCSRGCATCCCHWVEDVYSFEAQRIAAHLRAVRPGEIPRIVGQCYADEQELLRLDAIVDQQLATAVADPDSDDIDPVDLLLASFYQLRRPCPLLAPDGSCSVYALRPHTCRIYLSFSDPAFCDPDYINDSDIKTYLCDLEEQASDLLDRLHERYVRFANNAGLRSLLTLYLTDEEPVSD